MHYPRFSYPSVFLLVLSVVCLVWPVAVYIAGNSLWAKLVYLLGESYVRPYSWTMLCLVVVVPLISMSIWGATVWNNALVGELNEMLFAAVLSAIMNAIGCILTCFTSLAIIDGY